MSIFERILTGNVRFVWRNGQRVKQRWQKCTVCKGTGTHRGRECGTCEGAGGWWFDV